MAAIVMACGSAATGPLGDAGTTGDGSTAGGGDASTDARGGGGGDGGGGGRGDGGGTGGDGGLGSNCHCNTSTQFCLHGDVNTLDQPNVESCVDNQDGCTDCTCYMSAGVCLEQGTPESCSVIDGTIVVRCAQVQ